MKHTNETLALLHKQIGNEDEVLEIAQTAKKVVENWINPTSGGKEQKNGLIYGLVQSGKTGVLTVTGAMGADEGYRSIIVLTSDNDALYAQTLNRVREAFPGMEVLEKQDFKDATAFLQRIKSGTCALVATKNSSILNTLIENFKSGRVRGLSCLIIDDEADQASLNTKAKTPAKGKSTINGLISDLRDFFEKNTYLQVTATPQALFLQTPGHQFRPEFTVLSHPGTEYVGGEDFFGEGTNLVRDFPLSDIGVLSTGGQPSPRLTLPKSLVRALDTFVVAATYKRMKDADQNCAFLCHVSTRTADHAHIVNLMRKYKNELSTGLKSKNPETHKRLQEAYDDLAKTHSGIRGVGLENLLERIEFYSRGIHVKLVNGETDEDVAVTSPLNLFVGGSKLGRGVTIKNLLVSYYGRNPRAPQADTVLQHARMYGYRRKDIGLLRLFLPPELLTVFRAINKMEKGLRDLIEKNPNEEFRGVYVENGVNPTRKNVLAPGAIGVYSGGGTYNPAQVSRSVSVRKATSAIDTILDGIPDKNVSEVPIALLRQLVELTVPDPDASERVWDQMAIAESLTQFSKLRNENSGCLYIDRDRGGLAQRRETQGLLTGGEAGSLPTNKLTLVLFRTKAEDSLEASWWPMIRFPSGRYGFAFAI